jgi:HlyD family secretion protein
VSIADVNLSFAKRAAIALFAFITATAGWRYWRDSDLAAGGLYQTHLLSRGVVERSVVASGAVKALTTVDVGSQVSGSITEMKADFNSKVKQGDLLAVIDRAPFEARVTAATANLAIAKAEVARREAAAAKVQKQADLESAKATVVLRQADLTQAEINLNRTIIRSPIDGVVIDRRMQRGQTVTAEYQTPVLFQIAQDLSQILILTQVDEADVGAIHTGDKVTFSVEAFPDEGFSGVVDQIRLAAIKTSGIVTYTVVVRAQNPNMRLFPDMTATVRIVTACREDALNVPNEAIRFRPAIAVTQKTKPSGGQIQLWVLDAHNWIQPRLVRLGIKGDMTTEILDGELQPGDAVILRAGDQVTPGSK